MIMNLIEYPGNNFFMLNDLKTVKKSQKKKVNLGCLKLYRAYSISFNSSNVANFFGAEFLKVVSKFRKRKGKLVLFCVPLLNKT